MTAAAANTNTLAYEAQLEMKQKQITALFEGIGGFSEDKVAPVVACPQSFNYRNRILIRSQWNGKAKKLWSVSVNATRTGSLRLTTVKSPNQR
ncbi:MAG: hypothetical protein CM1200mP29_15200 [Verrucomicrobiota bacterium]|nr:MAG: hypothetical protein CM1200mP29_15200 [Verrucomicrobiota bacterium]